MAKPYRDRIMDFLEENYLPDLQANIVAEHYIDPLHFQNTLNSHLGAAFSVQPILLPIGLVPPAQPVRGFRQPVLRRRGHAPRRRAARRAVVVHHRRESDR